VGSGFSRIRPPAFAFAQARESRPTHYAAWRVPSRTWLQPASRKFEAISACRRKALTGRSNDSITEADTSQCGTTDTSYVLPELLISQVRTLVPRRKIHRRMPADSAGFAGTLRLVEIVMALRRATLMPRFSGCFGQKGAESRPFFRASRGLSTFSRKRVPYGPSLTRGAAIPDDVASDVQIG